MDAASSAGAVDSDFHGQLARKQTISSEPTLTNGVIAAWNARCSKLGEEERKKFESRACGGLAEYLTELANACQEHRDESRAFRFVDWFEPLYTAVELFIPAAAVAVQAYPSPGSLILGGVIAALEATQRLRDYHKLTVQLLARMGRKAHILQAYETIVYKSDDQVQMALVEVYGDMIDFCQNATKLATKHKKTIVKVKGFMMSIFRTFEAQLGSYAHAFETHVEQLEELGRLRDKKRLKDLHDSLNALYSATGEAGGNNKDQLQRLGTAIEQLVKRNHEIERQEEEKAKENHRAALLEWLSPMSFAATYDQRCGEHLDGTGSWMLNSESYTEWKSGDKSDLLWVKGKPGCGKSVLAAVVVTDLKLEVEPDTALGYAFCRRDEESFQDPTTIFGALARQVSMEMQAIHPILETECKASQSNAKPSIRAIRQIMTSVAKEFRKIYLVVDALDECKDNELLAQELRDLVENKGLPTIKVIVFSRIEYKIDQYLGRYKQIEPDQGANEEDLKAYIRFRFPKTKEEKSINQKIRKECFLKADGMFLWVQLLAKNLNDSCLPDKEKLKLIQKIPHGLDSIYDRILDGICGQTDYSRKTAFLVLLWVMFAWRPLSRKEMLDAVADFSEARKLKDATRYDNAEHLVAICANLVFIDRNGYFRLCHESARTYLEKLSPEPDHPLSEFQSRKRRAHQGLAEICLNYLQLDDFERGIPSSLGGLLKLAERKPFLDYASNWDPHVNEENASDLHELIMKCMNSQPRRELSIQFALVSELGGDWEAASKFKLWNHTGTSNPLHRLAISGLKPVAMKLPDVVSLALKADGSGKTPLQYAVERRHHDMTVWLVDQIRSAPGQLLSMKEKLSLIHSAAQHGWPDLLETLLSENKDLVNLKMSPDGETPLGQASRSGSKEAAETLIRHEAYVNLIDGKGDYPLLLAAIYGHASIAHLLLAHGADPNCYDAEGFGPLFYAADIGNAEIATALLEKGADPLSNGPCGKKKSPLFVAAYRNSVEVLTAFHKWDPVLLAGAKPENGWSPLHGAAFQNAYKALRFLLEHGVPKDGLTDDAERETALNIAADMGFLDSVKVLVDAGCDPSLQNEKGSTALHAAARSGKLEVVQYILDKQPRTSWTSLLNLKTKDGEIPLHSAVHGENPGIVTLLLERGSNPEQQGAEPTTSPLHWAAEKGLTIIAETLLEHTKNADPRNSAGETPLHFAAKTGKSQFIVKFFQKAASLGIEVDVNAKSEVGSTALHLALVNGFKEVADFLLQQGAMSFCNDDGNYPIHLAAWQGYDSIVQKLLSQEGYDKRGYFGRTPLHCAVYKGQLSTVKLLSEPLAHVINVPDEQNLAPIYNAIVNRHMDVAHHLLDLGVDISGTNDHDENLLHIAAWIPDLAMTKRFLAMGLPADQKNRFGAVPLHHAARMGSTEVLNALVAAGFSDVNCLDSFGNSPALYAAEEGEFDVLRRLDALGASWLHCSDLGVNVAHSAAEKAHPEVFEFFSSRGVDLGAADVEGCTPLINAASEGNTAVVSYLLQTQAHAVNHQVPFKGATALILAVKNGYPRCTQVLLAAGADPHIQDMYGISALEYAAFHRPCLREMHNAHHLRVPVNAKARKKTLFNLLCQLSEMIPETRSQHQYFIVSLSCSLSIALLLVGDYEAAKAPLVELMWPPKFSSAELRFTCCICRAEKFAGDKYVCQTCLDWTCMCKTCHTEFETAKGKMPDSLKEVVELEKRLLPVRLAILQETSLYVVTTAMRRFVAGCDFTKSVLEEYELWEQKHNSSKRFHSLLRPGQELIKLVMELSQFFDANATASASEIPELMKTALQLQERYDRYVRKHGFIKDLPDFRCEDHKFMVVTEAEAKELKAAGTDLGPEGRLSDSYLQRIAEKYQEASAELEEAQSLYKVTSNSSNPGNLSREGSSGGPGSNPLPHKAAAKENSIDANQVPPPLRRSLTVTVRQRPPKRPISLTLATNQAERDVLAPSSPFTPVDRTIIQGIRRAQTLPISYSEDLASSLDISPARKKTMCAEPGSVSQHPLADIPVAQEVGVTASRVVELNTELSAEPEEIGPADSGPTALEAVTRVIEQAMDRTPPKDITAETRAKNEANVLDISLQLLVAGVTRGEDLLSIILNREALAQLGFALHVTAAMVPGFVDLYLTSQQDEHDLARENNEEVVATSSSSSDGGSDDDSDSEDEGDGGSSGEDDDSED